MSAKLVSEIVTELDICGGHFGARLSSAVAKLLTPEELGQLEGRLAANEATAAQQLAGRLRAFLADTAASDEADPLALLRNGPAHAPAAPVAPAPLPQPPAPTPGLVGLSLPAAPAQPTATRANASQLAVGVASALALGSSIYALLHH
jgi:hypothetical protein